MVSNGKTLSISHTGANSFRSLHDILFVLDACENLLSVSSFTKTNLVSIELFPTYFLVKDLHTRNVLYQGQSVNGLYSMVPDSIPTTLSIQAHLTSLSTWHVRLGHASLSTVKRALHDFAISFSLPNVSSLCHACSISKIKELP